MSKLECARLPKVLQDYIFSWLQEPTVSIGCCLVARPNGLFVPRSDSYPWEQIGCVVLRKGGMVNDDKELLKNNHALIDKSVSFSDVALYFPASFVSCREVAQEKLVAIIESLEEHQKEIFFVPSPQEIWFATGVYHEPPVMAEEELPEDVHAESNDDGRELKPMPRKEVKCGSCCVIL